MFIPERKELKAGLREYEKVSVEVVKQEEKLTSEEKKELFKKYIEDSGIKKSLESTNISQINRFYSLLEERKFSFESNKLKEFVDEQIKRGIGADGGFYDTFKKTFLNNEYIHEKRKSAFLADSIKRCIRYCVGVKKLDEKLGEKEGE